MGKVLLFNPPGDKLYLRDQHCSSVSKADYYWPPIDLIIQSGIISQEHDTYVLDAMIENLGPEQTLERITSFKPDSIIFITGIASWLVDFEFIEKAKEITGARLIASGGFLRHDCEDVMNKYPFLDAVLLDFTSDSILTYLKDGNPAYDMCVREEDRIVRKPLGQNRIFNIPVPRHDLFPLDKYRIPHGKFHPFTSMLTNYGCPYQCSYCIAEDIDFKYRTVENIIPELDELALLGIKEIFFKDFTFGMPSTNAKELCQVMTRYNPKFSWVCSSRVNVLDEETLHLMKRAGCHTIQFGVESASQEILDDNNKKIQLAEIEDMFAMCRRLGIKTLAHFILGLPGETEESLNKTIEFAKKISCDFASFNVAIPLPGTTLRARCLENNWLIGQNEELDASRGYPVIETPLLSRESLWRMRNQAVKSFYLRPSYILKRLQDTHSPNEFFHLCREGISLLTSIKG